MLLLDDAVGIDHAQRVLPGVEAGDLGQERPVDVDPELVDDVRGVLGGERHVLGRQGIDRGRPDEGLAQRDLVGHVLLAVEDRGVVALERGARKSTTSRFGVDRSM